MTCASCGGQMTSKRANHRYTAGGFDHVTLVNVEVRRCKSCGEWEVVIPRIEELHRTLAKAASERPSPADIAMVFDSAWKAA